MCIIFYNETGKIYNREHLSTAYDNNPHGVGLMWVEGTSIKTLRGLYTKEKMFEILGHFDGVPHALHLRWRTRGLIKKNMCHPFRASHKEADKDVFMMHNGTFMNVIPPVGKSDTHVFASKMREVTEEYGTNMLFEESFLRKTEKHIQSFNKVIFLRNDRKVAIMNPNSWTVVDGMWLSNTYSLEKNYRQKGQAFKGAVSYFSSARSTSAQSDSVNFIGVRSERKQSNKEHDSPEQQKKSKRKPLTVKERSILQELYELAYAQRRDQLGRPLFTRERKRVRREVRISLKKSNDKLSYERSLLKRKVFESMVSDSVNVEDSRSDSSNTVVRRRRQPDGTIVVTSARP